MLSAVMNGLFPAAARAGSDRGVCFPRFPSIFGFQPSRPVSCILSFPLKTQQTEQRGCAVQRGEMRFSCYALVPLLHELFPA